MSYGQVIAYEFLLLVVVFLVNIPFGYYRANKKKFSKEWIFAIHAPIPLVAMIRIYGEIPISHIPLFIMAYFLGQIVGVRIRKKSS